ncbi:hypothetical protein HUW46_03473 [Amycolatopsis sp. CA-230715]|nr:hypothetical protein HUW46_03473 [Amycolatopsis sp. CA-230715]
MPCNRFAIVAEPNRFCVVSPPRVIAQFGINDGDIRARIPKNLLYFGLKHGDPRLAITTSSHKTIQCGVKR